MNKLKQYLILFLVAAAIFSLSGSPLLAQTVTGDTKTQLDAQNQAFLTASGLGTNANFSVTVSQIIKVFLSFLGIIFIVLIIYAGYTWMLSAGNEEKISQSKKIIISATIGLAIVLSAYFITFFVIDNILKATNGSGLGSGSPTP